MDLSLLRRRPQLRLLLAAQVVSLLGSSIALVAIPFQVYELTGSTLLVGLLGAVEFVPIVVLAIVGGALADALDRRRLMLAADVGALVVALALVLLADQLWALFTGAGLLAALYALQRPPMDALFPRLVERDELKTASAIQWLMTDIPLAAGPALGGVVIAVLGVEAALALDAATFAVSLVLVWRLRPPPGPAPTPVTLAGIGVGLRYAGSRQHLLGSYLVDMNAMFFGVPQALFPALASRYGGAEVLGLLYAAPYAGSFLASVVSGWTNRVHRHGRGVVLAAAAWGVAIIAFGLAPSLVLALVALALAGGADAISGIFRAAIWNESVPDALRGRLAGIEMVSYTSGPTLGSVRAGAMAAALGLRTSVVASGVACVAGCFVVARLLPGLWAYDARRHGHPEEHHERPGGLVGAQPLP